MTVRKGTEQMQLGTTNTGENYQSGEYFDDYLRCILICHDVLRIQGKLSGSSQDELVMMEMIEKDH